MTAMIICAECRAPIAPGTPHQFNPHLMTVLHQACVDNNAIIRRAPEPLPLIDVLAPVTRQPDDAFSPQAIAMVATRNFVHFKGGVYRVKRLLVDASSAADRTPFWQRFAVEYERINGGQPCARPLYEFLGRVHTRDGSLRRFWPHRPPVLKVGAPPQGNECVMLGTEGVQCNLCQLLYSRWRTGPGAACPHCGSPDYAPLPEGETPMFESDLTKGMNDHLGDDRLEKAIAAEQAAKAPKPEEEEDEILAES